MAVFFVLYLAPLVLGWNQSSVGGGSHVVFRLARLGSAMRMVGRSTGRMGFFMLAARATCAELVLGHGCAIGWVGARISFLPRPLIFIRCIWFRWRSFVMVLAGCAIGTIYESLRKKERSDRRGMGWDWRVWEKYPPCSHYVRRIARGPSRRRPIRSEALAARRPFWAALLGGHTLRHYAKGCQTVHPAWILGGNARKSARSLPKATNGVG